MGLRRKSASVAIIVALTGFISACREDGGSPRTSGQVALTGTALRIASGRADMVTGGSALVEVALPAGADAARISVRAAGRDQTAAFLKQADGRVLGLVTGLPAGQSAIEVTSTDASFVAAGLTVTNQGVNSPVLLQSYVSPYVCATPEAVAASGSNPGSNASGLSTAPTDAQCSTATETKLWYRTQTPVTTRAGDGGCSFVLPDPSPAPGAPVPATPANSCFQPYVPGTTAAAAVATTTPLNSSAAVPYIVRVERGVIGRGIYEIAVLFDPSRPWTWSQPQSQWTRGVVHNFGGGTGQPRLQARPNTSWVVDTQLARGFMVVVNSLTDSANNSNRVLVAETVMKMKEHVIENYGELRYYIGNGGSGGAINQNITASITPGVLDGLQIQLDFPDSVTTAAEVSDCVQLVTFYASPQWASLVAGLTQDQINAKKTAINGHLNQLGCHSWTNAFGNADKPGNYRAVLVADATGRLVTSPTVTNNCRLPLALVYDPASNPNGIRCSDADAAAMVWGLAPGTNRANRTSDNTGVQYGLKALLAGAITPEEFVTLNQFIGGIDQDSNVVSQRSVADPEALRVAYRSGIVASGTLGSRIPIIDQRTPDEQGIHYNWRSFSQRDRLSRDAGSFTNQVIWRHNGAATGLAARSLVVMDSWLTALNASAPKPRVNAVRTQGQVVAARPTSAYDFCYLSTDPGFTTEVRDFTVCDRDPPLVIRTSPRQVAGGPRTEDVLKCQLKPFALSDYPGIGFTTVQIARLQAVFAAGVCDWSRPGVAQEPNAAPLTFRAGPSGVALGAEPTSTTI